MIEQIYKVLINKVDSEDPEEVRFGKYCYLFNDRIYTSASLLPEKVLPQLEEPLPEIVVNKRFGEDIDVGLLKTLIKRKRGRPSKAQKKWIEKESLESEVKTLSKRKLSQRIIATKLGISRAKVQRILA